MRKLNWPVFFAGLCWMGLKAEAAQTGPLFPTHHYPTDQSFHLTYGYSFLNSSENFVDTRVTEPLPNGAQISLKQHRITAEYQPDRRISAGLIFHYDSIQLTDSNNTKASKKGLGDQRLFGEYRFFDRPGMSFGGAVVIKFPLYSNPTYDSLVNSRSTAVALLGDAQTDFTVLGTSEFWTAEIIRIRADFGYTYRTEKYAGEFPFLAAIGFVKPRFDFDIKFSGNLSQRNDSFDSDSAEVDRVRGMFGSSQYAYAKDPWVLSVHPTAEFWMTPEWAVGVEYKRSLIGESSPYFWEARAGLTYRWSETDDKSKRKTFKDVDISTDQEAGIFPGESQIQKKRSKEEVPYEFEEIPKKPESEEEDSPEN